jgi:hypothetical protein
MSHPYAQQVWQCVICELPWEDHIKAAYWRMVINENDPIPSEEDVEKAVSFEECIHLLRMAHQGPPGPQGPMGPSAG